METTPIRPCPQNKWKWKIDDEAACIFFATFVDDKGDGVFRQLIRGALAPDLVPAWALDRNRNPA
jgi:hypothetical protein